MTRHLLFITACTLSFAGTYAQNVTDSLEAVQKLIDVKKYESAYNILQHTDPGNKNAEVVCVKNELLLKYFVTSIMHQMFALKDLEPSEDVMDYRGQSISASMHMFDAPTIFGALLETDSTNCRLHKGLAAYYYEVLTKYGGRWLKPDEELQQEIMKHCDAAAQLGCAEENSYFASGMVRLMRAEYNNAVPDLKKALALNPDKPETQYNLAYGYMYLDSTQQAIDHAKKALELYEKPAPKADAARMIGQLYSELNDHSHEIEYLEKSDEIEPENFYTQKALLFAYIVAGKSKKAKAMREQLYTIGKTNPSVHQALMDIYHGTDQLKDLAGYYEGMIKEETDSLTLGTIYYYSAQIYIDENNEKAIDYFNKARTYLAAALDPKNPVFNTIDQVLEKLKTQP
ncbi:MAG: hypothetical protein H6585_05980 [Flavobacteriales bacterium]|nr:hypothetical protein [Flavobacteriales bacterium]MCB9447877.1 hypothetical protein [Flavobacteriales bacterium]